MVELRNYLNDSAVKKVFSLCHSFRILETLGSRKQRQKKAQVASTRHQNGEGKTCRQKAVRGTSRQPATILSLNLLVQQLGRDQVHHQYLMLLPMEAQVPAKLLWKEIQ